MPEIKISEAAKTAVENMMVSLPQWHSASWYADIKKEFEFHTKQAIVTETAKKTAEITEKDAEIERLKEDVQQKDSDCQLLKSCLDDCKSKLLPLGYSECDACISFIKTTDMQRSALGLMVCERCLKAEEGEES